MPAGEDAMKPPPLGLPRVFVAVMAIALLPLLAIFVLWLASRPALSQDCELGAFGCGHGEQHHEYKGWQRKGGKGSCCSNEDCRPVRARLEDDGGYSVWIPEYRDWIPVPEFALGEPDRFGDGRSHVCSSRPVPGMPSFHIYCFSPTGSKS